MTGASISAGRVGGMHESQRLSELVGQIYDAALDPVLWNDTLANIAAFVGTQACGLLSKDSVSKFGSAYYYFGVDARYMQDYAETYWEFDPLAALFFCDVEQAKSVPDLVAYDEFCQSRFYQEWLQPQGSGDAAHATAEKSGTSSAYLSVVRDEKNTAVDGKMRRRLGLVIPHVRRAILIGRVIDLKKSESATIADILDGLSAGLFLVDPNGRIVHANAAGHSILSRDDLLRSLGGRLVARDPQTDQTLRQAFALAQKIDAAAVKSTGVALIADDGERYVAHVLPLAASTRRGTGITYTAAAALFVRKTALGSKTQQDVISSAYKLTPTEARVLLAIVDVGGVPEVAEELGIAETTVKTHLSRLFEKTGTGRQADLAKLVAGFANPLVH
ncbi:MAG TPA: LuxR C-terminal-related transcriptional regulator [Xanthobacteraceae bacterium]|jgi:DNA-binding CsgD family transcriptional regulator|nr:LuxR C-terminal-related transcriptional regulator [Xanthobacteraceae bacterium]